MYFIEQKSYVFEIHVLWLVQKKVIKLYYTQYLSNFEVQLFIFPAELIPELYETALKYTPNSEDFLTQLFMGYVRIKEYKKQQQVNVRNILDKLNICWHRTGISGRHYEVQ